MAAKKGLLRRLFSSEPVVGLLLIASACAALYLANSASYAAFYKSLIHFSPTLSLGGWRFQASLHQIINDGLMSLFFFVVGMEVKRELVQGELSAPRKASLALISALGGMLIPALIYVVLNQGKPSAHGWGIPMATDIAFAIGVLSLMSHKSPLSLRIFLLSLAIIDDIGAVLVIALFYSQSLSGPFLALSALMVFLIFLYFKMAVKNNFILILLSLGLFLCVFHSGVHATLSGVLLGFLIPGSKSLTAKQAMDSAAKAFRGAVPSAKQARKAARALKEAHSPLDRFISFFHPFVSWLIMPLFAFFNAGVSLSGLSLQAIALNPASSGIFLGLFLGKPLGVVLFAGAAVFAGFAELPQNVTWKHILAVGLLSGIGFTMSLFISNLSFGGAEPYASLAKVSVLSASAGAAVAGLALLFFLKTVPKSLRAR